MCPDIEDGSEVVMEEVVQLLRSLLQLSGSLIEDGQLITSRDKQSAYELFAERVWYPN